MKNLCLTFSNMVTKRDVLYTIAKTHLGLSHQLPIMAECFCRNHGQKLGRSWVDPLPDEHVSDWQKILEVLTSIPCLDISWFVGNQNGGVSQLLVFCDVSIVWYATAIYLRTADGNSVQTNRVFKGTTCSNRKGKV